MGSGLLKEVGISAHIGGQVLTLKGKTRSLGMAFTNSSAETVLATRQPSGIAPFTSQQGRTVLHADREEPLENRLKKR